MRLALALGGVVVLIACESPEPKAGLSALVATTPAAASACASGGFVVVSGTDDNADGTLQAGEYDVEKTVCNGDRGDPGGAGGTGPRGLSTLVDLTEYDVGSPECPGGGIGVTAWVDTDGEGDHDAGEPTDTAILCQGEPGPSCSEYCDLVTASCTGENDQFGTRDECMSYCAVWARPPLGARVDDHGNSLGCRTYHAGVAAQAASPAETAAHCMHAGKSGGNVCGSWCENYCFLARNNCTGDDKLYADDAACMTACMGIPSGGTFRASSAHGNTVQCRIHHLVVAGDEGSGGAIHCAHGQATPQYPCADVPAPTLVINELAYAGTADVVEIYNSSSNPVTLGGWRLEYPSGAETPTTYALPDSATLPSHGWYAIASTHDEAVSDWLASGPGVVSLYQGETLVDSVSYGTGGAMAAAGASISRCPDGQDSNNSVVDFREADLTQQEANACDSGAIGFEDAKPIYARHCGGCHTGGRSCSGGGCWDVYEDFNKDSYYCDGQTKGACTLVRINDKSMPPGRPGQVPEVDRALLNDWIAAGMPE